MKKFIALLYFCATVAIIHAQSRADSVKNCPLQLTFAYPLGTNGVLGYNIRNNVSINLLTGIGNGVDGFEIAGLVNLNRQSVNGVQIAGVFNGNNGHLSGIQCSGFANATNGRAIGTQLAGFANLTNGDVDGGQGSGFANIVLGGLSGVQCAGFYNHSGTKMQGFQCSGFANFAGDSVSGTQIAGFCNIAMKNMTGTQASGFANIATGTCTGLQLSSFSNVATDSIAGTQITGFVNFARNINGFQIGIINISDTIKNGLPIGFMTITKGGYYSLEIEANEITHLNIAFKMGVKRFYNIYSAHASFHSGNVYWGQGYGFGSQWASKGKISVNTDIICASINKNDEIFEHLNLLNTLKLQVGYQISKTSQLFAGPAINVHLYNDSEQLLPYTFYEWNEGSHHIDISAGLGLGLRF